MQGMFYSVSMVEMLLYCTFVSNWGVISGFVPCPARILLGMFVY